MNFKGVGFHFFVSCILKIITSYALYLSIPYFLARLWWKGRRTVAYKQRIGERFGFGPDFKQAIDVWIHAVSLGEVVTATPLIEALLEKKYSVLVTTLTPTGSEQVKKRFGFAIIIEYCRGGEIGRRAGFRNLFP